MNTIPSEFQKILNRVKKLSIGITRYEDVFNPNFEEAIINFKMIASTTQWSTAAKIILPEISKHIELIKKKQHHIFIDIKEYVEVFFFEINHVKVDDSLRAKWYATIEEEITAYEIKILNKKFEGVSFILDTPISDDQIKSLCNLIITTDDKNSTFINTSMLVGAENLFLAAFKSFDIYREVKKGIKFNLNCKVDYAAFIFTWLKNKSIFRTNFANIEKSGIFYSQVAPDSPQGNVLTMNTLSVQLKTLKNDCPDTTIESLIKNKPLKSWGGVVYSHNSPTKLVQNIHYKLSQIFDSK